MFIRKTIVAVLKFWFSLFGKTVYSKISNIMRDSILEASDETLDVVVKPVETKNGTIDFYCIGELAQSRARTFHRKEPETIEWIDGFVSGDVLWDIGANVGVYSLYGGLKEGVKVLSFEPSSANYFLLNKNIEINNMAHSVRALCIAFNDEDMVSDLHMQTIDFAAALSSFDDPVGFDGEKIESNFLQGMVGYSIDSFIEKFSPEFPTHIKIDVDGIESKIVEGAKTTLRDGRLKSLSIELDESREDYTNHVIDIMKECGLDLYSKKHASMFEGTPYSDIYNYQFRRAS